MTGLPHDITSPQQQEAAMLRSEQRYRQLFDDSSDAIMTLEPPSWKFTTANQATVVLFGVRDVAQFVELGPGELSPAQQPDGRASAEKAQEMIETALRDGSHDFEWTHRRISGESFPATVRLSRMETDGQVFLQATVRDISKSKQAEDMLLASEAKYRGLIETTRTGYLILDATGNVVEANQEYLRLTGRREFREIYGRSVMEWTAEYEKEKNARAVQQCARDGFINNLVIDYIDATGRITPVEINATVINDSAGIRIISLCRDISERIQAEVNLREKELLLSESQRLGHVGSWFYDMQGPFKWSEELYRLYGVSPDTFIPTEESLLSLIHPDDRAAMQAWLTTCAAGARHELVFRINRPDGASRFILGRGESFHDAGNRLIHMAGTAQDITERMEAEEALRVNNEELAESREFVQAAMDSLQAHVCVVAKDGTLLAVNQAWLDFAAANPPLNGNIGVGADYLAVCDAATGPDAEIARAFATGIRAVIAGTRDRFEIEYPCHSPQQPRWFVGRVTRLIGEATGRLVVAHENITERKQAKEAIRIKSEELERFVYTVSHDLRSPVVTVQIYWTSGTGYYHPECRQNSDGLRVPACGSQEDGALARRTAQTVAPRACNKPTGGCVAPGCRGGSPGPGGRAHGAAGRTGDSGRGPGHAAWRPRALRGAVPEPAGQRLQVHGRPTRTAH